MAERYRLVEFLLALSIQTATLWTVSRPADLGELIHPSDSTSVLERSDCWPEFLA